MGLLIAGYYLLFAALAVKRLNWAVLLTIVALPSYLIRFQIGFVPFTLLEGMILIVFFVWLAQKIRNAKLKICRPTGRIKNVKFYIPMVLILLAATISLFVAPDLRAAAGIWKAYFIEPVLFFIIINNLLRNPSHPPLNLRGGATNSPPLKIRGGRGSYEPNISPTQIISAFSITALLLSVYAIYQRCTGFGIPPPWDAELRVTSIFPYPNALGLFLAPLVPLFVSMLFHDNKKLLNVACPPKPWRRWGYWLIVIIVSILAIIFAKSTGALVGIAVGILFMGVFLLRVKTHDREFSPAKKYDVLWVTCYAIIISVLVIILLNVPNIRNELLLKDWSGHVRRTQWSETITMFKDHPIFGAGLAGYKETLTPYHQATYLEIFEYPHNIILNFWSEIGLAGLAAFVWLITFFYRQGFRAIKDLELGNWKLEISAMAAMVVIIVHGLVDVPYFKNDLAILFWIIFALGLTNTEKFENIDQLNEWRGAPNGKEPVSKTGARKGLWVRLPPPPPSFTS